METRRHLAETDSSISLRWPLSPRAISIVWLHWHSRATHSPTNASVMKLINVYTLDIEEHFDDSVPEYAILSHTWGQEEMSLREWTMLTQSRKFNHGRLSDFDGTLLYLLGMSSCQDIEKRSGYTKVIACCEQAKQDGLKYVWADTCCIDKTSSAEISEAINSMFQWYKSSNICYAYLSDVSVGDVHGQGHSAICKSRWFSRGWTLQEFLAPNKLAFFDSEWHFISFKTDLVGLLSSFTGISSSYIDCTDDIQKASVAQRMSWASKRQTTRREDIAYCLMGIFDVSMPLLYGEGDKAFLRLQEEIVRQSEDHSYLAWGLRMPLVRDFHGLFARSPADFHYCADVSHNPQTCSKEVTQMSNKGLRVRLLFLTDNRSRSGYSSYAILQCCGPKGMELAIPIACESPLKDGAEVWRLPGGTPVATSSRWGYREGWSRQEVTVFVKRTPSRGFHERKHSEDVEILGTRQEESPIQLFEVFPPHTWIPSRGAYVVSYTNGRFFMRLGPRHAACSRTECVIIAINFKGTEYNQKNDSRITSILPKVIPAGEILQGKTEGPFSLLEMLLAEPVLFHEPLTDFCSKTQVCGYTVSVEVRENPWVVNISISSSNSKRIDQKD
jgi:Heterokaryon incompatibility protein (HET)